MLNSKLKNIIENLPKTAGVYLFWDNKEPIYIGKAINIKDRVKNHFFQPTYKDDLYIKKVSKIGFIETRSEIEALILEASLIKKHQPKFNSVWRDDKNYFYVAITQGERPIAFVTHQKKDTKTQYIGPFTEGNALKKTLKFLRKIFPFYTTTKHPKNNCTWCHLELCPGPNPDLQEYKKNIKKLTLILQGKRKTVLYALKKEMADVSGQNKFEEAMQIRDKISALEQVMSHANVIENKKHQYDNWETTQRILQEILQTKNPISKIECYDISNIQGTLAVASMVVFLNGKPDKNQYKKFRIKMENKPNDIAMLSEVLVRRLAHPEWGYPQVMLIDGGIAQLNIGIKTLRQAQGKAKNDPELKKIKIISIAKGKREILIEGQKQHIPLKSLPREIYNLIVHLDDEAHRFAITYHKKLRKKTLLT
ncbi:MAG: hypothetical protein A2908_03100 [Candidatus Staskawiczbacteria bacterium RIFCSPLOWO2_01_FULL_38_12b]|uniref:Excinuclease ABC subunit C n=1 Tax=Candidatus Staskawiczbacteria bacterium RIFCSPLOWO2_01_FULL_38_12b TaxID=1802214 RepID=A0A1G2ICF1_9BACT|nr:MAG: hypothetical protein A2908_03100 [Candidatus Staskawiczbacteria bacterium RIFCSPLOWO2_01_FULL_38_12b]